MKCGGMTVLALAVFAGLVLNSCAKPDTVEKFIPASKAQNGVFVFDFEMADTLSTYDFSFYTRIDGPQLDSLPLKVMWLSPDGKSFSETVYMNPASGVEPYRSGVTPVIPGQWRICVRPAVESKGFRGLGFVCKENGTR